MTDSSRWLRTTVCLGLLAGLLLSPKLWLSTRNYPQIPIFSFLPTVPPPFDIVTYGLMLLLLVAILLSTSGRFIAAFVCVSATWALFDQSRWQPWFYQYLFMLVAIGLKKPDACRLIIISVYFWSGIQKLNPGFTHETFGWMLGPLASWVPAGLALLAPVTESAIAIGLLTRRFRDLAVIAAIAMHTFIMASIGPFGHNSNHVVWPWNLAMGTLVILLFWRTSAPDAREILGGPGFQRLVLVLFSVMPVFSLVGLWDSYLSFALYSGNQRQATIYLADAVADNLPDEMLSVVGVYPSDFKVDTLDIEEWSYDELHVPPYAEMRVFEKVGGVLCGQLGNPALMLMLVEDRKMWFRRPHRSLYTCSMLQK